jgi:4-hydroxy-tetrahydrodipicolinate synthase
MTYSMPDGLGVALATPFIHTSDELDPNPAIDFDAFSRLINHVISGGADFLVVLGSTGEAATILDTEREELISRALAAAGSLPVFVGTGHNATAKAIEMSRQAARLGAAGLLVVTPYYNKPSEKGLVAHFGAIAAAVPNLPIIAYNVPGRTGQNLTPGNLSSLWAIPQIVAIKESSGNLAQIGEMLRSLPAGRILYSGDDSLALPAIALGARGLISVIGNLLPTAMSQLVRCALSNDFAEARRLHYRLLPLMDGMFMESNPAPLKSALSMRGLCVDSLRLPLVSVTASTREKLAALLEQARLNIPELI